MGCIQSYPKSSNMMRISDVESYMPNQTPSTWLLILKCNRRKIWLYWRGKLPLQIWKISL